VQRGLLSANRFVDVACTFPARIFGLHPRKGEIAPGSDADLVVLDPKKRAKLSWKTLHMAVDHSPYEGMSLRGRVEHVLLRGRRLVKDARPLSRLPKGSFLRRAL
jgi:dihydropyrimidinase